MPRAIDDLDPHIGEDRDMLDLDDELAIDDELEGRPSRVVGDETDEEELAERDLLAAPGDDELEHRERPES